MRISTEPDGHVICYRWTNRYNTWKPSILLQGDYCDLYARCEEYSSCNIDTLCSCLDGFRPKNVEAWSSLKFSDGCVREMPLSCSNKDDFVRKSNMKLPDTRRSSYNFSINLEECKMKCLDNCSCTAYANANITEEGSGCLLWFGGLIDIKEQDQGGDVFYVRVGASGKIYIDQLELYTCTLLV